MGEGVTSDTVREAEETGYVSEKALDSVTSGSVPLFHGATEALGRMLPAAAGDLGEVWPSLAGQETGMSTHGLLSHM